MIRHRIILVLKHVSAAIPEAADENSHVVTDDCVGRGYQPT